MRQEGSIFVAGNMFAELIKYFLRNSSLKISSNHFCETRPSQVASKAQLYKCPFPSTTWSFLLVTSY